MNSTDNLYNAAVIGENAEMAFIVEGKHLHAVEKHVADLKKDKSNPKVVVPLIRDALKALMVYAEGKVPPSFIKDTDLKTVSLKPNEQEQLIEKIFNIYTHLHHQDRNYLSSLIHHKAAK